jgi:hypothetical protein
VVEGDKVIAFDAHAWMNTKKGDMSDNSIYFREAVIKTIRKHPLSHEVLADIVFECGKESRGHFLDKLKPKR